MVVGHDSQEMELWPSRLVQVDENRWALITKEIVKNAAHITQGAISVSYLHQSNRSWTLERLWPEIVYSGVGGEPANAGEEVRQFGSGPIYLATGEWCGMGTCTDTISAISLTRSGPIHLGEVVGGAWSTTEIVLSDPYQSFCEDYAYTAVVGPPASASGIFSVTYDGWTAPPNARTTKTRFHLTADAVRVGNQLALRPKIHLPDCGL